MAYPYRALHPLKDGSVGSSLYRAWLGAGIPDPERGRTWLAGEELAQALQTAPAAGRVFPGPELMDAALGAVVTGQQPGLLGGPLYTLYKIATAVAVARRRTASGRPTVPVFWSADDDDDLTEAFEPVAWRPQESGVLAAPAPRPRGGVRPGPVGDLPVAGAGGEALAWLEAILGHGNGELGRDLVAIYHAARDEGGTWAQLQAEFLRRAFRGHGLVLVSGNDPALHGAAHPLYEHILAERESLAETARRRGAELESAGWHAQIGERSLARPLFRMQEGRRVPLDPADASAAAADLRPGVLLRSPVQDWLIRPVAVVVGPGELAYLRQLDPLYAALGIPCPPRVPRLTGWLAPPGTDPALLAGHGRRRGPDPAQLDRWAEQASETAATAVREVLARELNLPQDRAGELAAGRARRFRKGVRALLEAEAARQAQASPLPGPAWLFPQGARQERRLGSHAAAVRWGDELIETLIEAADAHLAAGLEGRWSETLIEVE